MCLLVCSEVLHMLGMVSMNQKKKRGKPLRRGENDATLLSVWLGEFLLVYFGAYSKKIGPNPVICSHASTVGKLSFEPGINFEDELRASSIIHPSKK